MKYTPTTLLNYAFLIICQGLSLTTIMKKFPLPIKRLLEIPEIKKRCRLNTKENNDVQPSELVAYS